MHVLSGLQSPLKTLQVSEGHFPLDESHGIFNPQYPLIPSLL